MQGILKDYLVPLDPQFFESFDDKKYELVHEESVTVIYGQRRGITYRYLLGSQNMFMFPVYLEEKMLEDAVFLPLDQSSLPVDQHFIFE
jgi:hypothetical protein